MTQKFPPTLCISEEGAGTDISQSFFAYILHLWENAGVRFRRYRLHQLVKCGKTLLKLINNS